MPSAGFVVEYVMLMIFIIILSGIQYLHRFLLSVLVYQNCNPRILIITSFVMVHLSYHRWFS